jgi:hypothetical protein
LGSIWSPDGPYMPQGARNIAPRCARIAQDGPKMQTDRQTGRQGQTKTDRQRQRQRHTETDRVRQRQIEGERNRFPFHLAQVYGSVRKNIYRIVGKRSKIDPSRPDDPW